jgi:hypothetical protein
MLAWKNMIGGLREAFENMSVSAGEASNYVKGCSTFLPVPQRSPNEHSMPKVQENDTPGDNREKIFK